MSYSAATTAPGTLTLNVEGGLVMSCPWWLLAETELAGDVVNPNPRTIATNKMLGSFRRYRFRNYLLCSPGFQLIVMLREGIYKLVMTTSTTCNKPIGAQNQ